MVYTLVIGLLISVPYLWYRRFSSAAAPWGHGDRPHGGQLSRTSTLPQPRV